MQISLLSDCRKKMVISFKLCYISALMSIASRSGMEKCVDIHIKETCDRWVRDFHRENKTNYKTTTFYAKTNACLGD